MNSEQLIWDSLSWFDLENCNRNEKKFIIKACRNDLEYVISNNHLFGKEIMNKCLLAACYVNSNLDVIKYMIEKLKIDTNYEDEFGNNCFSMACCGSIKELSDYRSKLDVIKYLAIDLGMNVNHTDRSGNNVLIIACSLTLDQTIFKHLVNELNININHVNNNGDNGFTMACLSNPNLADINFLVNEFCGIIHQTNIHGRNGFTHACRYNRNPDVAKYLSEHTNIKQIVKHVDFYKFSQVVEIQSNTDYYSRFNELLDEGTKEFEKHQMTELLVTLNPLLLKYSTSNFVELPDPFSNKFRVFIKQFNKLSPNVKMHYLKN